MLIIAVYGKSIYWNIIKQWKRIKLHITTNQFKIYKAVFRSHTDYVILNIYTIRVKGMIVIEMATHSSILAWRIPWTEEPGRLQAMGLHKELDTTEWLTLHFHVWKVICDGLWSPDDVHFFSLGRGAHRYSFYSKSSSHTLMLGVFSECAFYLTI